MRLPDKTQTTAMAAASKDLQRRMASADAELGHAD